MNVPQVKILDKYIVKKFLGTFFFTIVIAVAIVVIFDLSEKIDKFVEKSVPVKEIVFDYFGGFIPWIVNSFSPLLVFISAIFFTSKLAQNSEIVAMLSGGISFRRLMAPYMFSAAVICGLSLLLGLYIIPPANQKRLDFENKYIKPQTVVANTKRDIHYQLSPGEFVYVGQFSSAANTAYGFTLERMENGRLVSKLSATSAAWDTTFHGWKLRNYYIRDFYGDSEMVRTGRELDTVIALTIDDFYRRKNAVESMSGSDLDDLIQVQKMRGDDSVKNALIEKNNRPDREEQPPGDAFLSFRADHHRGLAVFAQEARRPGPEHRYRPGHQFHVHPVHEVQFDVRPQRHHGTRPGDVASQHRLRLCGGHPLSTRSEINQTLILWNPNPI